MARFAVGARSGGASLYHVGEPVAVQEVASSRAGYVRFETDRSFSGMGHERYVKGEAIYRDRPVDKIARELFDTGKVDEVHVYAQTVTVKLAGTDSSGIRETLEEIFTYYRPGVEVPTPESFGAEG